VQTNPSGEYLMRSTIRPAAESFRLLKFVEETYCGNDLDMEHPQAYHYTSDNPRIKIENGDVVVWNDVYHTSLPVKNSVVECCILQSPPSVLVITYSTTRIICFISEEPAAIIKLATKFVIAKEYRQMA
jgi:hypothetical protein